MKHISILLNGALVGLVAFLLLATGLPRTTAQAAQAIQATEVACNTGRSIQVSGAATINVIPDRALIQLGVQSNGTTAWEVKAANEDAIVKITKSLEALGIESKDITTDFYVIEPVYETYNSLYIKGYRINNVVAVTIRNTSLVNDALAVALASGANQVINVDLYTSELRKYRDQARDLAMKAANEKALALATAGGTTTGCVLNINENSWSYYNGWWYGRNNNQMTQNVVQNASPSGSDNGQASDDGPVNLGQIAVKAEVSVSYTLK